MKKAKPSQQRRPVCSSRTIAKTRESETNAPISYLDAFVFPRSTRRMDWRGAETRGVSRRISARCADPRESRANGYSRESNGRLSLTNFVVWRDFISFLIKIPRLRKVTSPKTIQQIGSNLFFA